MAFAYLVSVLKQGTSAGSGNSAPIDTTGANLIVDCVSGDAGVLPTDSKSNVPTPLTIHGNVKLYYSYNPAVGSGHTFAANAASSFGSISAAAFSGAASSPLDQQNGATVGSGTSLATGPVTPTEPNQLLVMGLGDFAPQGAPTAITIGTLLQSASINGGVSYGNAIAYEIQTAATTRNPLWSWSGALGGTGASAIGTFKAAAAPVPPDTTAARVLNYGVWRRRREEYARREEESLAEIARELAADLDEGLPDPPQPEPAPPGAGELEAASLALSRAAAALAPDETVTARLADAIETRLRSEAKARDAEDEEAILALLLTA